MSPPSKTACMLVTGEYFDYLDPDPSVITLDVLEHGLAVPRFNNQTTRPIHATEHSLRVARIAIAIWDGPAIDLDDLRLWSLLHDAHEALVPWGDCLSPGKTPEMKAVEAQVDVAICQALGIHGLSRRVHETVKAADMIALYFEAMLWQPGAEDWAPAVWVPDVYTQFELLLPAIAPRPGECWRTEVEAMIGKLATTNG